MTLWTPDGERTVGNSEPEHTPVPGPEPTYEDLTDEQKAQANQIGEEMAEARKRLAETPAAIVVLNHMMGLYELAAIHLSNEPPTMDEAKIAIDAMSAIAGVLEGKLGEEEPTVRDALAQIQMAFVSISSGPETD
ncbi:MAG: hypothetical protein IH940_04990 [Acidobacteria bacterium]|nr:hypothetical protein [Acidobacteriota bacterium]